MALPNGMLVASNDANVDILAVQKYRMILVTPISSCQMALILKNLIGKIRSNLIIILSFYPSILR